MADETTAELSMLCGFDDDLAAQATAISNRLRGFLTQIHPHLERVLGLRLSHPAVLELLKKYPAPAELRSAGAYQGTQPAKEESAQASTETY